MKTKLAFGLIASSFLVASAATAQGSGQHARHHSQPIGQHRMGKRPATGMCCCMQGGMMGGTGMQMQAMPMSGMKPMPPMGQKMQGMPGQMAPPPMDSQTMSDMQAQDQKLEGLVKAMNEAPQDAKLDAAIAVINEMSAQHAAMKKMMMGHLGQMRGMGAPVPAYGHNTK